DRFFNECVSMDNKNLSSLLLTNFNELEDNDILIYADPQSKININGLYKIKLYYTILESYDMITFTIEDIDKNNESTLGDQLFKFDKLKTNVRCIDKVLMIKKTKNTMNMLNEWVNIIKDNDNTNINHPKINNY